MDARQIAAFLSVFVGGVLLVAAGLKALSPTNLSEVLGAAGAPARLLRPLARLAATLEVCVGMCLVVGVATLPAQFIATLFLVTASVVLALAAHRGSVTACQCFGSVVSESPTQSVARNGLLIAASMASLGLQFAVSGGGAFTPREPTLVFSGSFAGVAFVVVWALSVATPRFWTESSTMRPTGPELTHAQRPIVVVRDEALEAGLR